MKLFPKPQVGTAAAIAAFLEGRGEQLEGVDRDRREGTPAARTSCSNVLVRAVRVSQVEVAKRSRRNLRVPLTRAWEQVSIALALPKEPLTNARLTGAFGRLTVRSSTPTSSLVTARSVPRARRHHALVSYIQSLIG